jgi:hypothetical protein
MEMTMEHWWNDTHWGAPKCSEKNQLRTELFVHQRTVSAVRRVEFASDRMCYLVLRGRWCDIVLNVHAPAEDKGDYSKDSF